MSDTLTHAELAVLSTEVLPLAGPADALLFVLDGAQVAHIVWALDIAANSADEVPHGYAGNLPVQLRATRVAVEAQADAYTALTPADLDEARDSVITTAGSEVEALLAGLVAVANDEAEGEVDPA